MNCCLYLIILGKQKTYDLIKKIYDFNKYCNEFNLN